MNCAIKDPRVCLTRVDDQSSGACVFCLRQQARDRFRSGVISFEEFRQVLADTNERAR